MRALWSLALLTLAAGSAAAQSGPPAGGGRAFDEPPRAALAKELEAVGVRIQGCWQRPPDTPAVPIRVRVVLDGDGALKGAPVLVDRLKGAEHVTDSLLQAIRRCAPYRITALPSHAWKTVQIVVKPGPSAGTAPVGLLSPRPAPVAAPALPLEEPTLEARQQPLQTIEALRARVWGCWRPPADTPATSVRVRLKLDPGGALDGDPVTVTSLSVAASTTDDFVQAIRRCGPYRFTGMKRNSVQFDFDLRTPVIEALPAATGAELPPRAQAELPPAGQADLPPPAQAEPPWQVHVELLPPGQAALLAQPEEDEPDAATHGPVPTVSEPLANMNALRGHLLACWSPPERRPAVAVRIKLKPDGALDGDPVALPGANDAAFRVTARSLVNAIRRCAPYRFADDFSHEVWKAFVIAFVP